MTGVNTNFSKMLRWLKDKRKPKEEKKFKVEDDYGFRKKQIIVKQTENGHSVIIKDNGTTLVYPQSFCRFFYRARMPTPVQNFRETSNHIYDEIPELLGKEERLENEADLIKDTRNLRESQMDLKNAIEMGPYLIVPIVNNSQNGHEGEVEILKRRDSLCDNGTKGSAFRNVNGSECDSNDTWTTPHSMDSELVKDAKVVLTRCVKSKPTVRDSFNLPNECHTNVPINSSDDLCSFKTGAQEEFRIFTDSPGVESNSRTLTGTPDSCSQTPDTLSERSESCAIPNVADDKVEVACVNDTEVNIDKVCVQSAKPVKDGVDGNETGYEYDLSTSGESEQSRISEQEDYDLYLAKIESNLELKHNVRKLVNDIDSTSDTTHEDAGEVESMTYVSSLSECSSAACHVCNLSADRSESDDSSGYYECFDENNMLKELKKKECCVTLSRSASAPDEASAGAKSKSQVSSKRHSKSNHKSKSKSVHTHRKKYQLSDTKDVYKALSDEDKELYKFPSSSTSSTGVSSRHGRGKPVLAPQPTPVYMDPYRGKSGRHNRLLGDLIRMNYDKQLFIH